MELPIWVAQLSRKKAGWKTDDLASNVDPATQNCVVALDTKSGEHLSRAEENKNIYARSQVRRAFWAKGRANTKAWQCGESFQERANSTMGPEQREYVRKCRRGWEREPNDERPCTCFPSYNSPGMELTCASASLSTLPIITQF